MHYMSPVPSRLPEPPPAPLDLTDADRVVGRIEGDRIAFHGFADANEAVNAAWVAYLTVARHLAERGDGGVFRAGPPELGADGDAEVIFVRGRPIATLLRPEEPARDEPSEPGADSFAFALRVPAPADALEVRSTAFLVYRALRKAGVRWAMWREPMLEAATDTLRVPIVEPDPPIPAATGWRPRPPASDERIHLAIVLAAAAVVLAVEWLALWTSTPAVVAATLASATALAVLVWRLRRAVATALGALG